MRGMRKQRRYWRFPLCDWETLCETLWVTSGKPSLSPGTVHTHRLQQELVGAGALPLGVRVGEQLACNVAAEDRGSVGVLRYAHQPLCC